VSRDNSSCHSISAPVPAVRIPGLNTSLGIASCSFKLPNFICFYLLG
jgi:hypothetical protein